MIIQESQYKKQRLKFNVYPDLYTKKNKEMRYIKTQIAIYSISFNPANLILYIKFAGLNEGNKSTQITLKRLLELPFQDICCL